MVTMVTVITILLHDIEQRVGRAGIFSALAPFLGHEVDLIN